MDIEAGGRPLDLEGAQLALGVLFNDLDLLTQALTHESWAHDEDVPYSNERLEFLGDAVLGLVVSHHLYATYPQRTEGQLTTMRSKVVSRAYLSQRSRELGLGEFVALGRGEASTGGRERASVLADVLEAVVAALYLDQGMEVAREFVLRVLADGLEDDSSTEENYKGRLQEHTQKHLGTLPLYRVTSEEGPSHARRFSVEVHVGDVVLGEGSGASKKQAEQAAARAALDRLQ